MRLKKCFAVFAVNFVPSHNVIEKTCKWALNILLITSYLFLVVLKDLWADLLAYNLCSNVVLLCQTQSHLLQNEFHFFTSFHWAICLNLFKQKLSTSRPEPAYFLIWTFFPSLSAKPLHRDHTSASTQQLDTGPCLNRGEEVLTTSQNWPATQVQL